MQSAQMITGVIRLPRLDGSVGDWRAVDAQDASFDEHVLAFALGRDGIPIDHW